MKVLFGKKLLQSLKNRNKSDSDKVFRFAKHLEVKGFEELEGRNKSSDNVSPNDPMFVRKVRLAQLHDWWHYHIGIASYDMSKPFGKRTSEFVLHYSRKEEPNIKLAKLDYHPPFLIPPDSYLN